VTCRLPAIRNAPFYVHGRIPRRHRARAKIVVAFVRIRPFRSEDRGFIVDLVPRLTEFGEVPGRDRLAMNARDREVLERAMDAPPADTAVFVAEDGDGRPVGFIHLTAADDYYTSSRTAHIADVIVAKGAEGQGIGSALIAHGEQWARERGFQMLTLNVFLANHAARDLYVKRGFEQEWVRCVKRL
jgi:GNAT superfamily N-acetyltransferase